jgi:methyl-accepting chemotaxis protein
MMIAATAGAGWWGMRGQQRVQQQRDELDGARQAVQQFQYTVADITGWQGLVVADAGTIGGAAATLDSATNRAGFLEAKVELTQALKALDKVALSKSERERVPPLSGIWDGFFREDDEIIALLRTETTAGRIAALHSINEGVSADAYDRSIEITDQIRKSLSDRSTRLRDRTNQTRDQSNLVLGGTLAAALLLAVIAGTAVTRSVVRPLRQVVGTLGRIARGDLTARVDLDRRDELGALGIAVDRSTEALQAAVGDVRAGAQQVRSIAAGLLESAERMAGSAAASRREASEVSGAADTVLSNLRSLVEGSQEMSKAIQRIGRNTEEAAQVAKEAVDRAQRTSQIVTQLGGSSAEITHIVGLINGIAGQTNLLALNATIEAARAGEWGSGFAVVAVEVKELAQETGKATGDISERVTTIQGDTGRAVAAIEAIGEIIGRINGFQATIANEIGEQMATTHGMDDSIRHAAVSGEHIAAGVDRLHRSNEVTSRDVGQTQLAATELAMASDTLKGAMAKFRI